MDENQELENVENEPEMSGTDKAKEAIRDAVEATYRSEQSPQATGEAGESTEGESAGGEPEMEEKKALPRLDLNTATVEELRQLPGIGPALAERIVQYRTEVQPFEEPSQITAVPGISKATYTALADRLTAIYPAEVEAEVEEMLPEAEEVAEPEEALSQVEEEAAEEEGGVPPEAESVPGAPAVVSALPSPPPPPKPRPVAVASRGDGWGRVLFVGVLSAIAGAVLALVVLFVLNNGTLAFRTAASREIRRETFQLSGEIDALRAELGQMQGQVAAVQDLANQVSAAQNDIRKLSSSLTDAQTQIDSINTTLDGMRGEFTNLREDVDGMASTVSALSDRVGAAEDQLVTLGKDLQAVQKAAQRFDTFLTGLRGLLEESLGPAVATPPRPKPATPTPTPVELTITPLPTPTPWETPTPASGVTVIPLATYTPTVTAALTVTPTPTITATLITPTP
jgi:competence ComEA-like helix-hairpin-helix protein